MSKVSLQQLRGAKELIQNAVHAGVNATERVHQAIARRPYAVLERIEAIAIPVQMIERMQSEVTTGVYHAIRTVNKLSGVLATQVIDRLEQVAERRKHG